MRSSGRGRGAASRGGFTKPFDITTGIHHIRIAIRPAPARKQFAVLPKLQVTIVNTQAKFAIERTAWVRSHNLANRAGQQGRPARGRGGATAGNLLRKALVAKKQQQKPAPLSVLS